MEKATIPAPPGPTSLTDLELNLALIEGDRQEAIRLRERVARLEAALEAAGIDPAGI